MRRSLRSGTGRAHLYCVNRKLFFVLAAIVLPGGFIALLGAAMVKALSQTERGKRVFALAEKRMRALGLGSPLFTERQAA